MRRRLGLDSPVQWKSARQKCCRTGLPGGAAAEGGGGPQARWYSHALPGAPSGGGWDGRGAGEKLPTKCRHRATHRHTGQDSAAGAAREQKKLPGAEPEKAAFRPLQPPGVEPTGPEAATADGGRGYRRPGQGTDRAGTEEGRPKGARTGEYGEERGCTGAAHHGARSAHTGRSFQAGGSPRGPAPDDRREGLYEPDRGRDSGRRGPRAVADALRGRGPGASAGRGERKKRGGYPEERRTAPQGATTLDVPRGPAQNAGSTEQPKGRGTEGILPECPRGTLRVPRIIVSLAGIPRRYQLKQSEQRERYFATIDSGILAAAAGALNFAGLPFT